MTSRRSPGPPGPPRRRWTAADDALLRARFPDEITRDLARELGRTPAAVANHAASLGLHKSATFFAAPVSGRLASGSTLGRSTRFAPGLTPWNKGTHYVAGGRSAATRFKPGEHRGAANRNWRPVGSYRISRDGYLQRKVTEAGSCSREYARRWQNVHRLVWIAAHGPIPPHHVVWFKPGQRTTVLAEITPDRLECISLRESMRRNSLHTNYPPELQQLMQLRGVLTRKLRQHEEDHA
jgi:hypothetical protein